LRLDPDTNRLTPKKRDLYDSDSNSRQNEAKTRTCSNAADSSKLEEEYGDYAVFEWSDDAEPNQNNTQNDEDDEEYGEDISINSSNDGLDEQKK